MYNWMNDYDVFPRTVPAGCSSTVTVKPLGRHAAFDSKTDYRFEILPLLYRSAVQVEDCSVRRSVPAVHVQDCLAVTDFFEEEQEFYLFLYRGNQLIERFNIYSLKEDLYGRLPLLGDLHMHSIYSDGNQAPEIVAAECRRRGYDFMTLTDHHNYAGSLSAHAAYKNIPIDLTIVPGEEVHLPGNDIHIVNFGGNFSVNFQVESNLRYARDCGISPEKDPPETWCAMPGFSMPSVISEEQYRSEVEVLGKKISVPEGVEHFPFLSCQWICWKIHEAGGLSIFAHPYWIKEAYQVPETMTDALMEHCSFDCFEVLGGEKYLNQNEFQTWHYVRQREKGNRMPVVGNSDSHNIYAGKDSTYAATILFAEKNEREALIFAVKEGYSVAVDLISREKRLVGDIRLLRYARYLLEAYFPATQELYAEEGRLMKAYVCGTDSKAGGKLTHLSGQSARLQKHLLQGIDDPEEQR